MVEYILCYGGPAEHWDPLPATRLASRKILIEQNIKKRTGPALCVLCVYNLSLPPIPRAPQHFLNQLIFHNVVIEIPVAQTSVE
jgi:hypothetical protein